MKRLPTTGEKGVSPLSGKPLHFKGSTFHRIIRNFMYVHTLGFARC